MNASLRGPGGREGAHSIEVLPAASIITLVDRLVHRSEIIESEDHCLKEAEEHLTKQTSPRSCLHVNRRGASSCFLVSRFEKTAEPSAVVNAGTRARVSLRKLNPTSRDGCGAIALRAPRVRHYGGATGNRSRTMHRRSLPTGPFGIGLRVVEVKHGTIKPHPSQSR